MKNYETSLLLHVILKIFLGLMIVIMSVSCNKKNFASAPEYQFSSVDGKPDYSNLNYWAAHPWKKDPSDSVPKPLRVGFIKDSAVDVFLYIPPL
jgi:hypothetical protein